MENLKSLNWACTFIFLLTSCPLLFWGAEDSFYFVFFFSHFLLVLWEFFFYILRLSLFLYLDHSFFLPPFFLNHSPFCLLLTHPLLLHFYSGKGRPPEDINQVWLIELQKTRYLCHTRSGQGNTIGGKGNKNRQKSWRQSPSHC